MGVWTATVKDWADGTTPSAADFDAQLRDFGNAFGALTSYTPTLSGFTAGNGVALGRFLQVQKLTFFTARFTFGTTSAAAPTSPSLTLPVPMNGSAITGLFRAYVTNGSTEYMTTAGTNGASLFFGLMGASGAGGAFSTTTPFTWATGHQLICAGLYEAA